MQRLRTRTKYFDTLVFVRVHFQALAQKKKKEIYFVIMFRHGFPTAPNVKILKKKKRMYVSLRLFTYRQVGIRVQ